MKIPLLLFARSRASAGAASPRAGRLDRPAHCSPVALLFACSLTLASSAVEMITLPVLDPPKSEARPGENIFNFLPRAFQKNPQFEMTIRCELTPHAEKVGLATPTHPIYYALHDAGPQEYGERMGVNAPPENLSKLMIRALSANGYLPAEGTAHPPSLLVIYHWGASYALSREEQVANPWLHYLQTRERSELIGEGIHTSPNPMYKSRVPFRSVAAATQALNSLYFTTVSAYDYASVARGERLLVWRAHLTANAAGVSMTEALPALVLTAGTSLGRETNGSQYVTRRALRGKVTLGPLLVVQNDAKLEP